MWFDIFRGLDRLGYVPLSVSVCLVLLCRCCLPAHRGNGLSHVFFFRYPLVSTGGVKHVNLAVLFLVHLASPLATIRAFRRARRVTLCGLPFAPSAGPQLHTCGMA